jgi:hypothetical protein
LSNARIDEAFLLGFPEKCSDTYKPFGKMNVLCQTELFQYLKEKRLNKILFLAIHGKE